MKGKLYLIPSPLGGPVFETIPGPVAAIIRGIEVFFVENDRSARGYLHALGCDTRNAIFHTLGKNTGPMDILAMINELLDGRSAGVITEAGLPGVADPGAQIAAEAHAHGIDVIPLPGPSSITMALSASGMNGQSFIFHGYLPVQEKERVKTLRTLERRAREGQTQIFIETPYRNNKLLGVIVTACSDETLLCIAADLTLPTQFIRTMNIGDWKKRLPNLEKRPAVFLLG